MARHQPARTALPAAAAAARGRSGSAGVHACLRAHAHARACACACVCVCAFVLVVARGMWYRGRRGSAPTTPNLRHHACATPHCIAGPAGGAGPAAGRSRCCPHRSSAACARSSSGSHRPCRPTRPSCTHWAQPLIFCCRPRCCWWRRPCCRCCCPFSCGCCWGCLYVRRPGVGGARAQAGRC